MIYIGILIALIGIVWSANNLVNGATNIARRFRISEFIVGALIVGVGTSMPERVVSVLGAANNNPDIAIGNVVGSNIFNILGILGLTAIIFPIHIKKENKFYILWCLFISCLLTFCVFATKNNTLNLEGGWVLAVSSIVYIMFAFLNTETNNYLPSNIEIKEPLWKSSLKVIGGLCVLIIICDYFIDCATCIAKQFGLSDSFIALTIIACGTSLPELAASVVAAYKNNTQLALGNIIGSNIFNIAFILGICQISPLTSTGIGFVDYIVMIAAVVTILICCLFKKIGRLSGLIMLSAFIGYIIYLLNT